MFLLFDLLQNNEECGRKAAKFTYYAFLPCENKICLHTVRHHQQCGAADRVRTAEMNCRNFHSQPCHYKPTSSHAGCEIPSCFSFCQTANNLQTLT